MSGFLFPLDIENVPERFLPVKKKGRASRLDPKVCQG
jgi:hypothetical protein